MSKQFPANEARNRRRRPVYSIPDIPEPEGTRCVTLVVPDNLGHLAALAGALRELTKWSNWALDSEHNATKCAKLWAQLLNDNPVGYGECPDMGQQLSFSQEGCLMIVTDTNDPEFSFIYDPSPCIREISNEEINNSRDDGNTSGGGQQPGQGTGTPGACYMYHVHLNGNDRYRIPFTLQSGDTITISNARGAWSDNNDVGSLWFCSDGDQFVLGACVDWTNLVETDPLPTVNHMRLVGQFGETWADMHNDSYVVPAGSDIEGYIQANDVYIGDNTGSIEFDIEVCKGAWCYTFDFTISDGGMTYDQGDTDETGTWVSGTGWRFNRYGGSGHVGGFLTSGEYPTGRLLTMKVTGYVDGSTSEGSSLYYGVILGGTPASVSHAWSDTFDFTVDLVQQFNKVYFGLSRQGGSGDIIIQSMELHGSGINPFGSDNC